MKNLAPILLLLLCSFAVQAQNIMVVSPNKEVCVEVISPEKADGGSWSLKISGTVQGETEVIVPGVRLGLIRSDQTFSDTLRLVKSSKPRFLEERYTALHGKRSNCSNAANEQVVSFENSGKSHMDVRIRAYNDGVAFRYEFPGKGEILTVLEERTAYVVPDSAKRWLEPFNPANEALYAYQTNGSTQRDWGYPALFQSTGGKHWFLLHEADLDGTYCGTKLSNRTNKNQYELVFPDAWNGRNKGTVRPSITLPWESPWRVIVAGSLADIVESTLVDDVSSPSVLKETGWIQPGIASWNYWSDNHGTKSYKTVCNFADLAARMGWPYTLLDWEWDAMSDGGNLEDALKYIHSLGVKPLIWYNSGGDHTWVGATPKDRMLTHTNRVEEFTKLRKLGVAGVKIDFFESEKQDMIQYYLDILKDAADFQMMVYFHGCLVPRGWARTYPHLMTYEGVRGAEWYNNGPEFSTTAPAHNTTLPFTRNVVGSMDYTPVTFTNSQHPHMTSFGHELALSVVFESGIQHMADRPEGYDALPDEARNFLRHAPNAWDDLKLLSGYPGKDVVLARRSGKDWYIGGLNGELREKKTKLSFDFLPEGVSYRLTLLSDGAHDRDFSVKNLVVNSTSTLEVGMLRRGGFTGWLRVL